MIFLPYWQWVVVVIQIRGNSKIQFLNVRGIISDLKNISTVDDHAAKSVIKIFDDK